MTIDHPFSVYPEEMGNALTTEHFECGEVLQLQ